MKRRLTSHDLSLVSSLLFPHCISRLWFPPLTPYPVGDIIDEDDAIRSTIIRRCDRSKPLLSCRVPLEKRREGKMQESITDSIDKAWSSTKPHDDLMKADDTSKVTTARMQPERTDKKVCDSELRTETETYLESDTHSSFTCSSLLFFLLYFPSSLWFSCIPLLSSVSFPSLHHTICSFTVFLSTGTVRKRKSTPIVLIYESAKLSSWRIKRNERRKEEKHRTFKWELATTVKTSSNPPQNGATNNFSQRRCHQLEQAWKDNQNWPERATMRKTSEIQNETLVKGSAQ